MHHKSKKIRETHPFPKPIPLKKLIGPSFVVLALGLGSGEVILWPYMAANYGLGIVWGAVLGITFQYFINMEIERYALIKGESVFVGLHRLLPKAGYWFIISTFVGFGLPGIISASAKVFASVVGVEDFRFIAIGFLIFIGIILSAGKTVYGMMEKLTKIIILLGVPFVFVLAVLLGKGTDWSMLANGIVGKGEGFWFLPEGVALATFFAAFAYSGAGGNLNLTQSIYIKEKGYGMGKYAQKISGLFTGKKQERIQLDGAHCAMTEEDVKRCKIWWKRINIEHLLVFWFIGLLSMLLLMLLSYATVYGSVGASEGINFVIYEGHVIGEQFFSIFGTFFLVVISIMLFQTQLGVMDSTSRIMSENVAVKILARNKDSKIQLSKVYFGFVWAQIAFGIILFLLKIHEPKTLIVLGAVLNAVAMFVHTGLVSYLNHKTLPKQLRPSAIRKIVLGIIFIFFGFFSVLVLLDKLGVL